jgi:hypothetical protein
LDRFALDFIVKKRSGSKQPDARIFSGEEEIAEIKREAEGKNFRLARRKDGLEWSLTNNVHGEPRPFSFSVHKLARGERLDKHGDVDSGPLKDEIFVIREQLFKHNGKFYMLANHPMGKHWDEHVHDAVKYIGRLDGFDDAELSQVDYQSRDLRDKIKRLRGTAVGEASGLGIEEQGHRVRLDEELADVGLFIAAISYLMYAAA